MKNLLNKQVTITFTNETIVRLLTVTLGTLIGIRFLSAVSGALQLVLISVFLAIALNPAVSWIAKHLRSKNRVVATSVAYLLVLAFITGFLIVVLPPLVRQTVDVVQDLPTSVDDLENQNTAIVRFIKDKNLTGFYTDSVENIKDNFDGIAGRAVGTLTTVGSAIVSIITVLVMTFMLLIEAPYWIKRVKAMQPADKLAKRERVVKQMYRMVTGYVNGQLLIASIAALFAFVALMIASTIFDAQINAVSMAFIVGVVGLIPMIGNTLAAAVVVLICAFVSFPLALTMAGFFLVYQQVENATLQPLIQAKYNALTPLLVFIAALLGVHFAGLLGALIAIPAAGCIRIYMIEYHGRKLGLKTPQE